MPLVYQITYLTTGSSEDFYCADGLFYKVGENAFIRLRAVIAWCKSCHEFVDAESIEPEEEFLLHLRKSIEKDRNRIKNFDSLLPDRITEKQRRMRDHHARNLTEAQRTIEWRLNRKSPAKCLYCGSTEILTSEDGEPIVIPGRGKVRIDIAPIFADVSYMMWKFTPEGDRIKKETDDEVEASH